MFLKKLFLASASVLMLALAYHLGASTATAQGSSNPAIGIAGDGANGVWMAVTYNGDTYVTDSNGFGWMRRGNIFNGAGSTSTPTQSWGSVKVQQR